MDDHLSFSDLLPLYTLGVLSEAEKAQVEAWLAKSPEAREELRLYQAMLTGLATTVPPRKAPAQLIQDFKKRLEASAEWRLAASRNIEHVEPIARLPRARWVVGFAAMLLVVISAIAIYLLVSAQNYGQSIQAILSDKRAARIALAPQSDISGAATVIWVDGNSNCLLLDQLPSLPPGQQYQLWMINDKGERDSGLVFDGSQTIRQWLMTVPDPNDHYVGVQITIEPSGGSQAPTTAPVFSAVLPG